MDDAFKIIGLAVIAAAAALLVKRFRPELGLPVSIGAGIAVFAAILGELHGIFYQMAVFAEEIGISISYIKTIIKIIGIVYLVQFAADTCRDAGETAIASKVELAGRVLILTLCIPMIKSVLQLINGIGGEIQ